MASAGFFSRPTASPTLSPTKASGGDPKLAIAAFVVIAVALLWCVRSAREAHRRRQKELSWQRRMDTKHKQQKKGRKRSFFANRFASFRSSTTSIGTHVSIWPEDDEALARDLGLEAGGGGQGGSGGAGGGGVVGERIAPGWADGDDGLVQVLVARGMDLDDVAAVRDSRTARRHTRSPIAHRTQLEYALHVTGGSDAHTPVYFVFFCGRASCASRGWPPSAPACCPF